MIRFAHLPDRNRVQNPTGPPPPYLKSAGRQRLRSTPQTDTDCTWMLLAAFLSPGVTGTISGSASFRK